jgi:hypothetical protein
LAGSILVSAESSTLRCRALLIADRAEHGWASRNGALFGTGDWLFGLGSCGTLLWSVDFASAAWAMTLDLARGQINLVVLSNPLDAGHDQLADPALWADCLSHDAVAYS